MFPSVTFSDFSQSYSESFLPFQAAQRLASHFLQFLGRKKEFSPPTFTFAFFSVQEAGLDFHLRLKIHCTGVCHKGMGNSTSNTAAF